MFSAADFPHRVTIQRSKYQRQPGSMASVDVPVDIATNVPAWIQPLGRTEIEQYDKKDEDVRAKVYLLENPAMRPGDEMTVVSGPTHVGTIYDYVASDPDCTAGLGLFYKAIIQLKPNPRMRFAEPTAI